MEWETSLEVLFGHEKQIDRGEPIEIYIADYNTYERKYVTAIIFKEGNIEGGEKLWVRNFQGQIMSKPWNIKIIETFPSPW